MAPTGDIIGLNAIESLRALPWELLRPSALVDCILFFSYCKPAVRLLVKGDNEQYLIKALLRWCHERELDFAFDSEGFVCIASNEGASEHILGIDRRSESHEIDLGLALGYPLCCCERVAAIGESGIDAYAIEVALWTFAGSYQRINPCGYRQGLSLISHLPCSPTCEASLEIANQSQIFLMANKSEPIFSRLINSKLMLT